jgi:hypothetical protein
MKNAHLEMGSVLGFKYFFISKIVIEFGHCHDLCQLASAIFGVPTKQHLKSRTRHDFQIMKNARFQGLTPFMNLGNRYA